MRPGAEAAAVLLALLLGLVPGATGQEPQAPPDADDDVAAVVTELDDLDQPPTAADLAALLDEPPAVASARGWKASAQVRWRRNDEGAAARDAVAAAGGARWDLRLRVRTGDDGDRLAAGTGGAAWGPLRLRLGGWTWSSPCGLLAGAAGRSAALTADGGLVFGAAHARGWSGWPDDRAGQGGVLGLAVGPVAAEAAVGTTAAGRSRELAAVGARDGGWQVAAARDGEGPPAFGAAGRWRRGAWHGAWELATTTAAARPAAAVAAGWQAGRTVVAEALVLAVPRGASGPAAASLPLLGTAPGRLRTLRLRWKPQGGVRLAVLAARAERDGDDRTGPEERLLGELLGAARLAGDVTVEARLRTAGRTRTVWSEDWPWAPPVREPGRRTRSAGAAVSGSAGAAAWRVRLASIAVDHSATVGRRTLLVASLRRPGTGAISWQTAWRAAWGDPVDLADAVSPLPGLLASRHWGRWDQGWFVRIGLRLGPGRLDAAADLRTNGAGERSLELWAGATATW